MFIRNFLLIFSCLATFGLAAQSRPELVAGQAPVDDPLLMQELKFDFGMIPQGKPVYHPFVVKNTGKAPIKLENVQAACGCTTPEWSRDEIAPGGTTVIRVGYNAAAEGNFDKPVTIYYGNKVKQFSVTGTVWRTPDGPAPRNNSIDLLKKQSL